MEKRNIGEEYGPLFYLKINWSLPLQSFIGNRVLLDLDPSDNKIWEELDRFKPDQSETSNNYQSISFPDSLTLAQVRSRLPHGFEFASPRETLEYSINSFEKIGHTVVSGVGLKDGKLMSLVVRERREEGGWFQGNLVMNDRDTVFPSGTFFVLRKKS